MKPTILLCLDTDPQASTFDAVVAVDAGVEHLLRHGGVTPDNVTPLVHGAMFTRGGADLARTAIFVGGSDIAAAEAVARQVHSCFFGPVRVSVLVDPNGANTTAAAAVLCAGRHVDWQTRPVAVVLGTGPVGQRAARLLASSGARVRIVSRSLDKAGAICERLTEQFSASEATPIASSATPIATALEGAEIVIAAGPPSVELVSAADHAAATSLRVAIDLNAAPPLGVGDIGPTDKATERHGHVCYGALGVGGLKMKIHRAALTRLFESNDAWLDLDEVFRLGQEI